MSQENLQENVEIVRKWFDAIRHGDVAMDLWHTDLIVDNVPEFPMTGPYFGQAGLRQWWDELSEVIEGARIELDEATAVSEQHVLTTQRLVGVFSKTGIPVDAPWVAVFLVQEGKISRVSGFASRNEALKAAGVSE